MGAHGFIVLSERRWLGQLDNLDVYLCAHTFEYEEREIIDMELARMWAENECLLWGKLAFQEKKKGRTDSKSNVDRGSVVFVAAAAAASIVSGFGEANRSKGSASARI